jgi:ATP-binding cassette subfamily G (WHITE) protein 2
MIDPALNCISILRQLFEFDVGTIVFSIHQPRYSIFELFDSLLLMSHGQIVYLGLSTDMLSYFNKQGLLCKNHDNPADFALDILTDETGDTTTKDLCENYLRSPTHISTLAISLNQSFTSEVSRSVQRGRSFACQFFYISHRTLRNARRNWQPYFWQNVCAILLGLLTGLLYYKMTQTSRSSIKNRLGCIFFVVANQIFSTATALEPFIKERALFIHVSNFRDMS